MRQGHRECQDQSTNIWCGYAALIIALPAIPILSASTGLVNNVSACGSVTFQIQTDEAGYTRVGNQLAIPISQRLQIEYNMLIAK